MTAVNKTFVLFVLLLVRPGAYAQNADSSWHFTLKSYNTVPFNQEKIITLHPIDRNYDVEVLKYNHVFHPTFALQWTKNKGAYHELEVSYFRIFATSSHPFSLPDSIQLPASFYTGSNSTETRTALRYECGGVAAKTKNEKLVFMVGGSVSTYYNRVETHPLDLRNFASTHVTTGLRTFIIPRLNWHFSKRVFLDLNLPVCLKDFHFRVNTTHNPALRASEQRSISFHNSSLQMILSARLGIGIRL